MMSHEITLALNITVQVGAGGGVLPNVDMV